MKVNFFQPDIRPYRGSFFHKLSKLHNLDCTIYHGKPINDPMVTPAYQAVHLPSRKLLNINFQFTPPALYANVDLNIAGLDFHWPEPLIASLLFRKSAPFLFWGHGFGRSSIANKLKIKLINRSRGIILYSPSQAAKLKSNGVCASKIFVAQNSIDVPNFENYSSATKDRFLYVGRLQERKRLHVLIDAFHKYRCQGGSFTLTILGDGNISEQLSAHVERLGLEPYTKFQRGTACHTYLASLFSKAAAYVSPGDIGLGLIHALAYGVPTVTLAGMHHGPEISLLQHNHNGLLVTSEEQLVTSLHTLENDETYRKRLGNAAFLTYSNEASSDIMVASFWKAITSALSKR